MNKYDPYMRWLKGVGSFLGRDIKPSKLAKELYELEASCEDAAKDYGLFFVILSNCA